MSRMPEIGAGRSQLPIAKKDVAETFGESGVTVNHTDTTLSNGSIQLASKQYDLGSYNVLSNTGISTNTTYPVGIAIKPDGSKVYVANAGDDTINQYNLSTAWDFSTAGYYGTFDPGAGSLTGLGFGPNGNNLVTADETNSDVSWHELSTSWDITTASTTSAGGLAVDSCTGVAYGDSGNKLYAIDSYFDRIANYDLSTAYDITTASQVNTYSVSNLPQGLGISNDGKVMVWGRADSGNNAVYVKRAELSTAWDSGTAGNETTQNVTGHTSDYRGGVGIASETEMAIPDYGNSEMDHVSVDGRKKSGSATIQFSEPEDVFRWDSATFQESEDGETVTIDVQESTDGGATWTTIATDISRGQDISNADPSGLVRLVTNLERADRTNNPTVDAVARRWVV